MPNDKAKELTARELIALERGDELEPVATCKDYLQVQDALQSRIAELEALLKLVTPELNSTDVLSAVQEIFQLRWKDRIAELEKDKIRLANEYCELAQVWQEHKCKPAVVWHRYPEEKPGKTGYYIIHYTILNRVAFDFWQADKSQWDKYGEYIIHWACLPASPEETK